ncbi:MAG: right-handed parallel beta-helix repeat-containing protein [Desulfovibrio sp.]|nr:right-handed parallel beta-helix repeat-containing protein [Desulfovibrio sp.]
MKKLIVTIIVFLLATAVTTQAQTTLRNAESKDSAFGQQITYNNDDYIRVTTAEQFLNALGSGRNVLVAENTEINLTPMLRDQNLFRTKYKMWMPDVSDGIADGREAVVSEEVFDGRQLTLVNMKQLTIEGEGNSRIVVEPRYAFCLRFVDCQQCTVKNLTIGHTNDGHCEGGVIGIKRGWRVFLFDCDLYGCGTYGLDIDGTRDFSMNWSKIHDCTYGIMLLRNADSVQLRSCDFFHNREFALIDSQGCNVIFNDCRFFANNGDSTLFNIDREFYLMGSEIYHPTENLGTITLADQTGAKNVFDPNPLNPNIQNRDIGPDTPKAKNR